MVPKIYRGRPLRTIRILTSVVVTAAAGLAAMPTAQAGAGATIVGVAAKCVDVTWSQTADRTPAQLYDCNGTDAQNWVVNGADETIRALGKCLDVADASHADGATVQLFACNGTDAQRWSATNGSLINTGSGKCLDADGGSATGTPLQIWTCVGAATQAWSLLGAVPPAAPSAAKKGVSTWAFPGVADAVRDVGAGWYFDWSASNDDVPAPAEFVPMIWGPDSVNDADLAAARRSGSTLLGFNEPDLPGQANMTVEQALSLWPRLEQTGMRLGSPAVAYGGDTPGGWLDRFMAGARERGQQVDFIALHWYGSDFGDAAADHFLGYLNSVHERYGLPIWVTEFGLINFTGTPRYPNTQQIGTFIAKTTTAMRAAPYVERYAWFSLPAAGETTEYGLYREHAGLTAAGQAYRDAVGP